MMENIEVKTWLQTSVRPKHDFAEIPKPKQNRNLKTETAETETETKPNFSFRFHFPITKRTSIKILHFI